MEKTFFEKRYRDCIGKLEIDEKVITLFKISLDGTFLTVGHAFQEKDRNKVFTAIFPIIGSVTMKLVDFKCDRETFKDYAILKSANTTSLPSQHIPLDYFNIHKHSKKEFISCGYLLNTENDKGIIDGLSTFGGEIYGETISIDNSNTIYIRLQIPGEDLSGASGSPICVLVNGAFRCIGIQSDQYNNDSQKALSFAQPIGKNFKEYVEDKYSYMSLLFHNNFYEKRFEDHSNRVALSLSPDKGYDKTISDIEDEIGFSWYKIENVRNNLQKQFKSLNFKRDNLHFKNFVIDLKNDQKKLSDLFELSEFEYINKSHIRALLSLGNSEPLNLDSELRKEISHVIAISLSDDGEVYLGNSKDYDMRFKVPKSNPKNATNIIINILEDIFVDIIVFNNINFLKFIFDAKINKKYFSEMKVNFIKDCNFKIYGNEISENIRYASLLSCTRDSFLDKADYSLYENVWKQFLNYIITASNKSEKFGFTYKSADDFVRSIKRFKKDYGKISKKKAKILFNNFPNNTVGIFAKIIHNRPISIEDRKALAKLFGGENYSTRHIKIFKLNELPNILPFLPHIRFFIFMKGD